ncbi:type II secretion system protein GspD, partial [Candidatus Dependentiae bacterium]|nr:type II secretion system protein GspD [Candidatus Dependentiae bacterium]
VYILSAEKIKSINFNGSAKEIIELIAQEHNLNVVFDFSAIMDNNDKIMINLNDIEPIDIIKEASKNAGFELKDQGYLIKIYSKKTGNEKNTNDRMYEKKIKLFKLNYVDASSLKKIIDSLFSINDIKTEILHYEPDKIENTGGTNTGTSSSGGIEQTLGSISRLNKPSNLLLVKAPGNIMDEIELLVSESDKKPKQVLIKVIIAEISDDLSKELGIKWDLSSNLNFKEQRIGGEELLTASSEYNWGKIAKYEITALMKAISNDKKSKILSRPWVLTLNNELAQIKVTDKLPYVSSYTQSGVGVDIVLKPEIKVEEFGIKLAVLPRISSSENIMLDIYPSVTDFIRFETFGTGNTQTKVPFVSVRESYTKLVVQNDDIIVIGGLLTDKKVDSNDKIPFLNKIPVLGKLFNHSSTTNESSELIMFISAHILSDDLSSDSAVTELKEKLPPQVKEFEK